jgi:hypothetical protein
VANANDTLLLWPSRLYVGRFMEQMTADDRDGTAYGAHFGHAVANSDLQGEIQGRQRVLIVLSL